MIDLKRSMNDKWIFQKNTNSKNLIESYLNVINETKDIDKEIVNLNGIDVALEISRVNN